MNGNHEEGNESLFVDINVTPLVDVMLVLLVIFMVTAPFMVETLGVKLPEGKGALQETDTKPLIISLKANGTIVIADKEFDYASLHEFLAGNTDIKAGKPVFIEADGDVKHKVIIGVMSEAKKANVSEIKFMVESSVSRGKDVEKSARPEH